MASMEIIMPKLGESIVDATITKWLKQPGEAIAEEEPIVEIATDKVDSEIPSPVAGIVKELLYKEGDVVEVGTPIALIQTEGGGEDDRKSETFTGNAEHGTEGTGKDVASGTTMESEDAGSAGTGRFYSPLVRNIAKKEGITMQELDRITGTGKDGRVTRDDLIAWLKDPASRSQESAMKSSSGTSQPIEISRKIYTPEIKTMAGDEVIEMGRMRKMIMDHMIMSRDTSVHVTSVAEFDVTNLAWWRDRRKKEFEAREGEKLTFTPVFIWAVARTIKDFPMINSSVSDNKLIVRKNVNIGMATALPDGNLIVPVIRNADHLSLTGLAKSVNDLANRARLNKLQPDEIQEGTFTLTNVGSFDTLFATPMINQPQVAILATGAIKKKPVVISTPQGDSIAIRSMVYLSMSYDHRVIDGALGGMVLKRIGEYLQNWDINMTV